MVKRVDLIINRVNPVESIRLTEEIDSLRSNGYQEDIANNSFRDEFVVTLHSVTAPVLKDILRAILKIVDPDRIAIKT